MTTNIQSDGNSANVANDSQVFTQANISTTQGAPEGVSSQGSQEQSTQVAQVEGAGNSDTDYYAEYFDNITQPQNYGYPPQFQGYPQQQFGWNQQSAWQQPAWQVPQQQFVQTQQTQQTQQTETQKPAETKIDYDLIGQYLDEGNAQGFIGEIDKLVTLKAQQLFEQNQSGILSEAEKKIQQKFEEQQYTQTVDYMSNKILDGLAKANKAMSPYELEAFGNYIEAEYKNGRHYQDYLNQFNALKNTGQLATINIPKNANGTPISKEDFYINKALREATLDKTVNQQLRTPNNVVRQTMNPVIQSGNPAQHQQKVDYSAIPDSEFKEMWKKIN